MPLSPARLRTMLDMLTRQYGVPGAAIAVWAGGELKEAAAGVCNIETKVPATAETLFQIGSITKLYTTALAMQLVEEGKLDLDRPVRKVLPDFAVADEEASGTITLRHLLNHTSGIDGDFFKDAGRGEDRIEKYVRLLKDVRQVHPLGAMFSYCNAGFVVAGRMIEVAAGKGWDKVVRERISKPLGTPAFSTLPEQAMRHQTAIGHVGQPGALMVTPIAYLAQSNAPAGSMPMAKARDVIAFARMMMNDGVAANGTPVLSAESVHRMHSRTVTCPAGMHIDAIGLGSFLWDWNGDGHYEVFGHDGSTIGQAAWLRYHTESETAVALLTNGGNGKGLADEMLREIFSGAAGIAPPEPPVPDAAIKADKARLTGTYGKASGTVEVSLKEGLLVAVHKPAPDFAALQGAYAVALRPVNETLFTGTMPGYTRPATYHFLEEDAQGRALYLHTGARAHRRVA
ncbi:MAG: serine hydrolase domain-containing protein [Parvibaculum sp.]|uniref:serine hydrolase domain-containing protein n=1 Tax=Parvibaculum sp. TaxID=2024848 RepID=UPI002ABA960A|nr:serine hydrolase domain-containing protein [Parvibaculum sp.]MDZ4382143.1 serine hydrolase domain-containing protein [Parvibaculum sp.]